jgi:hypothetical protein
MKRCTSRWTTAIAAAALLGVPAVGLAQTPPQPPSTQTESQQPATASTPADHVRLAKQALSDIPDSSIPSQDRAKFSQLKSHLNRLDREVSSSESAASKSANAKWGTEVSAIDKILTDLIGPETGAAASTEPDATGTSGTAGATALDETARTKLQEVRRHVTEVASSLSGGQSASEAASSAAAEPSTPPAATAGAESSTPSTPPATNPATESEPSTAQPPTSEPPTAQPPAQPPTSEPPTSQPPTEPPTSQPPTQPPTGTPEAQNPATAQQPSQADTGAAKQALSDARDSLAQLTALPEAQRLQGETRNQVSQLIANFNELITTQTNWKASYDKVETSLNTLLATGDAGAAATSGTGAAATTGTSGTEAGAATSENSTQVDPKIRAKLVEFRGHLQDFAKAAGAEGNASTPSSTMPPAAATGSTMNPSNPESATNPTSPTTEPTQPPATSSEPAVGTSGATASAPSSTDMPGVDREQVSKELDAIQAILAQASNGSLNQAQIDQLTSHVQQLRQLLGPGK